MGKIHLIMPMGGAGLRFSENGFMLPKPLIKIEEKPFLYWSTMSIEKYVDVEDVIFVVLKKHINEFRIDKTILEYFPEARIAIIPKVLPGPVLTCLEGIKEIQDDLPILFNDCDHMFKCTEFNKVINTGNWDFDGGLLTFISDQPQFSYVQYSEDGKQVVGTIEKKVVSNHAICGAYTFRNAKIFRNFGSEYLKVCEYSEYYVSGLYNLMCKNKLRVQDYLVDFHIPFGTPVEYERAKGSAYFNELI